MKKNKGFTLIELLAVIVILAVIALIATPIIMNVINDSKKGAAKDAMFGYVKAVEIAATKTITATTGAPSGTYIVKDGDLYQNSTKILDVDFKGTKPKDSEGSIQLLNGLVVEATLTFDNVKIKHRSSESYSIGEEVYLDPTGAVADCNPGKEWTPTNPGTTCYKWNVIKDNGASVEMLLNHNITPIIAWVSKSDYIKAGGTEAEYGSHGNSKYGPVTALAQLQTNTNNWSKVETLTDADNVTSDNGSFGKYTIHYSGMKARFISAQEVANIGNDKKWTQSSMSAIYYSNAPWLNQNTKDHGDNSNAGYWTDTIVKFMSDEAWIVGMNADLCNRKVYYNTTYGIRPVARVLKSNI